MHDWVESTPLGQVLLPCCNTACQISNTTIIHTCTNMHTIHSQTEYSISWQLSTTLACSSAIEKLADNQSIANRATILHSQVICEVIELLTRFIVEALTVSVDLVTDQLSTGCIQLLSTIYMQTPTPIYRPIFKIKFPPLTQLCSSPATSSVTLLHQPTLFALSWLSNLCPKGSVWKCPLTGLLFMPNYDLHLHMCCYLRVKGDSRRNCSALSE